MVTDDGPPRIDRALDPNQDLWSQAPNAQAPITMRLLRQASAPETSWGIIHYVASSGFAPDEDAAGFDGWYGEREEALAIARDWSRRFPKWIALLVSSDTIWFGNGDFYSVRNMPLIAREEALTSRGSK
jgi:hypothetical protein